MRRYVLLRSVLRRYVLLRKIAAYQQQYADNQNISFFPAIVSTSTRMHGEFLRLLFLQAHRMPQPWTLRLTLNAAALAAASPTLLFGRCRMPRA